MAEETNKETIAGEKAGEKKTAGQGMPDTENMEKKENPGAGAEKEQGAEEKKEAGAKGTGDEGKEPQSASDNGADSREGSKMDGVDEEQAVDGEFRTMPGNGKKGSFFKRKKDKKDEKIEELQDQVKRHMAEFENFRKRTDREKSQMFDMGAKSVIEKILPVIDNFERGLAQPENEEDPFVQGMEKIYKSMLQELEGIGVKPIEAVGKEFDPNLHNAVMHCEDDSVGENIVVQELQKGYTYHDNVVRHSMVKVAN